MLEQIKDNPNLWKAFSNRIGIKKPLEYLDEGTNGKVYDIRDGRVIKLSKDLTDAYGSIQFSDNKSPYIVDIYDVFQIDFGTKDYYGNPEIAYGIVTKKLLPLLKDQADFINRCCKYCCGFPHKVLTSLESSITKVEARRYHNKIKWLEGLVETLACRDFRWNDFHFGNIMRDGRHSMKVIDLGTSYSNETPPIPLL